MSGLTASFGRGLRRIRTLPGYTGARGAVYRSMRTPTAHRALVRVARWGGLTVPEGQPSDYPTPGHRMAELGVTGLPSLLVDLTAVADEQLPPVIEELAVWQEITAGFRPVLLVNPAGLTVARRYGFVAEILPDAATWGAETGGDEIRAARVGSITSTYRAHGLLEVGAQGLSVSQRAFLSHLVAAGRAEQDGLVRTRLG